MNYDLRLLGSGCFHAGDIADVGARVGDIDTVDGQDADSLCGVRQSFAMGFSLRPAVCLAIRNCIIKPPEAQPF